MINDRDRFEGKPHALSDEDLILYWNEEVRNLRLYGHIGLLGLKEFVDPAYTGWPRTPYPYDYPPNYNQALAAKKQGAADTIDVMCQGDEERNTADWYRLLNCGFKCPISAGTDSALNIPYHLIAGAGRVYVQMEPKLSYEGWIEGYKQGRSFATNAPLLHFSVNEKGPGEEIHWQSGSLELKVRAEATSHVPMERMDLVVNGRVMASQKAEREGTLIRMRESLTIADSSWVAVRVRGKAHKLLPNDKALYAHSSPLYCYRSKRGIRFREDALYFIEQIDRLIQKVEDKGLFEDSAEKQKVIDLFRKGQTGCMVDWDGSNRFLFYAESKDGIHWVKPRLGQVEFLEYDTNFIDLPFSSNEKNFAVFKDPSAQNPQEKYKMLYYEKKDQDWEMYPAHSPDGIHWSNYHLN